MKKRIEKYFPAAMSAITSVLQSGNAATVIPREYQGYISGFGANILQMGLMPTLAVYADEESGSAQKKGKLLEVLALVLMADNGVYLSATARAALENRTDDLFKVAVNTPGIRSELRERLLDAAVAVKLCIRTFNLSKP